VRLQKAGGYASKRRTWMFLTEPATSLMAFGGGWWILPGPLFWLLLLIVGIVFLVRTRS